MVCKHGGAHNEAASSIIYRSFLSVIRSSRGGGQVAVVVVGGGSGSSCAAVAHSLVVIRQRTVAAQNSLAGGIISDLDINKIKSLTEDAPQLQPLDQSILLLLLSNHTGSLHWEFRLGGGQGCGDA